MKKRNLMICLFLCFAVAFGSILVSAATPNWTDVNENSWYYKSILKVHDHGIMEGKPGNIFAPFDMLSRAEFVTILGRLSNAEKNYDNPFTDVPAKSWYSGYVGWASTAGIVKGFPDNTFKGNQNITRQELMVMTARYLDYEWLDLKGSSEVLKPFTDEDMIARFAKESVKRLNSLGIVKGDDKGAFNPLDHATRAEAATIVARIIDKIDSFDSSARIGSASLDTYSLYSDCLDESYLTEVSEIIKKHTGVRLATSGESGKDTIVLGVDDTLMMLQYSIKESDGVLYVSVPSLYASKYLPQIIDNAIDQRGHFVIREGYEGFGTFTLDNAREAASVSYICETDKNPLSYRSGDNVTIRISLLDEENKLVSVPQFSWKFEKDSSGAVSGISSGISGQLILTLDGLSKPGTGHLTVNLLNRKGYIISDLQDVVINASVIFDFLSISTFEERPDDFDKYWEGKINTLLSTDPQELSFEKCPDSRDGFDTYDVKVSAPGTIAHVHITLPVSATKGSLPIIAEFDGYDSIKSDGPSYNSSAITVAVNRYDVNNHESADYYANTAVQPDLWDNPTADESEFLSMIMRDIQAIRFAEHKFGEYWNGTDIITTGGSMGGFQSIAVAALYDKVTECRPQIPWMCDIGGPTNGGRLVGWCPSYTAGSKYFDSAYFAEMFNGKVVIAAGLGDYVCPPTGVVALFNAFKCDKSITFTQCREHVASKMNPENKSYVVSGDGIISGDGTVIIDNGCAVSLPDYSAERTLTPTEEQMKACTDTFMKVNAINNITLGRAIDINEDTFADYIKPILIEKCGMDPSYEVTVDSDFITSFRVDYTNVEDGSTSIKNIEYTITDGNGNYYDALARFMIKKVIPEA